MHRKYFKSIHINMYLAVLVQKVEKKTVFIILRFFKYLLLKHNIHLNIYVHK